MKKIMAAMLLVGLLAGVSYATGPMNPTNGLNVYWYDFGLNNAVDPQTFTYFRVFSQASTFCNCK